MPDDLVNDYNMHLMLIHVGVRNSSSKRIQVSHLSKQNNVLFILLLYTLDIPGIMAHSKSHIDVLLLRYAIWQFQCNIERHTKKFP